MAAHDESKDSKGRSYDQITKNGTGSAASMGTGGTGESTGKGQGGEQSASRTDDLLAGDTTQDESEQAFGGGSSTGQLQTGMEGIGDRGNRSGAAGASRQAGRDDPASEAAREKPARKP